MQVEQLGFDLGERPVAQGVLFDPNEIRADMMVLLTEARNATTASPWDARTLRYNKIAFPLLATWLPKDEAEQLCFAFLKEIERIELLLAA